MSIVLNDAMIQLLPYIPKKKDGYYFSNVYEFKPNFTFMSMIKRPKLDLDLMNTSMIFFFIKCGVFVPGLLMQIMTIVFLLKGKSGFSKSARNWFLMVIICDLISNIYHIAELLCSEMDLWFTSEYRYRPESQSYSSLFNHYVWGIYRREDMNFAEVMCKTTYTILGLPLYTSPIALTFGGLLRAYSVKNPLKAKAKLTGKVDMILMVIACVIGLVIAFLQSYLGFRFLRNNEMLQRSFGKDAFATQCTFPEYHVRVAAKDNIQAAYIILLVYSFGVCASNLMSALCIIFVLFSARKARQQMSATNTNTGDASAETKATAQMLAMNFTLIVCFLVSRTILVFVAQRTTYNAASIMRITILSRTSSLLFTLPYMLNAVFAVGFNRKFYEFYFPCLMKSGNAAKTSSASAVSSTAQTKTEDVKE